MVSLPILVDLVCECLTQGRAGAQLPPERRRAVVTDLVTQHYDAAAGLDLEGIWQALLREPRVTERALGGAMVVVEEVLRRAGVPVRPVARLQGLEPGLRGRLLAECPVDLGQQAARIAAARPPADHGRLLFAVLISVLCMLAIAAFHLLRLVRVLG